MKIIYTRAVSKDVKKIKDEKLIQKIGAAIRDIKNADTVVDISNVKKLKGHPAAYRIKIGTYRLGFYFEGETVILARLLKRNDIYKVFPK